MTLPSGKEISNSYTNGLLMNTTTPEWTTAYSYGCGDLVSSITRGAESISYSYDGNLVTLITRSGSLNAEMSLSYNNDLRLSSFAYGGSSTGYEYDNDGLLITSGPFTIGRNLDNGLAESITSSDFSLNRSFNGYAELDMVATEVGGSAVYSYNLNRDQAGRIIEKVETVNGVSSTLAYGYDALGRLESVNRDGTVVEQYQYDSNGNRILETNSDLGITERPLSWSVEDHIMDAGEIRYEFDQDDKLAARIDSSGTSAYNYSSTGELISVTLPDGTQIDYIHDPQGRRIAKKVNGTIVEKYLWSGLTTLLAVYDGSDNLVQRFEYADGRMPYAMEMEGSTYYLSYDQVGTLRLVTDSSGTVVKRIDYDSFGNILSDSNVAFTIPFGFAGGLHDRDTGLVRFGHRDYMPEIGKWTAKDPILFAGGDTNLYGYVRNDPVNFVDPAGLHSLPQIPGTHCVTSCHPSERGETPKATIGGSLTAGTFTESIDQTNGKTSSQSSQLAGASIDITLGDKGDIEAGIGARHTGIGLNFDSDGNVSGVSGHYGWSWPPSFTYGSVSKKECK